MAGITGPVPNRSETRSRRNKPDVPIEKVTAIGVVPIPDLGMDNPHPIITDLYQAMRDSAQSKYYEPSDWQYARMTLHFVDKLLWAEKPSAMMLASVNSMLTTLLLTEGDRRRVRMEVERNNVGADVIDLKALFTQKFAEG